MTDDYYDIPYERVLRFCPYRTLQPWDRGGRRIATFPYNSDSPWVGLQRSLAEEVYGEQDRHRGIDNHSGFDLELTSGSRIHLRFSDWQVSIWSLPEEDALTHREIGILRVLVYTALAEAVDVDNHVDLLVPLLASGKVCPPFPADDAVSLEETKDLRTIYRKLGGRFMVPGPSASMTDEEAAGYGDSQEKP